MEDLPPADDEGAASPETEFLYQLWADLEAALEAATAPIAAGRLGEVSDHCQRAINSIRAWQESGVQ